ncbi:TonB-dependent receptor plug domain-containing protein [Ancylomarina euxinus]|nr:TonB-dependent receptor plug domain-containing protein [Ancylomarina euxinus]MCZ4696378.1 TonB-dependent receptor [Ancylomarina euxinus]MUP16469.1 TonB-dependent receptor [Ancylomarina euxinus]
MKLKFLFVLLGSFVSLYGWGQTVGVDTIHIKTVDILAPRLQHFSTTEKKMQIDSILIQRYGGGDLSSLLQKTSLVNISSNGSLGALSTVGMRGASATQTSVNWNGIPVNSLTTGSADLSLINAGSFDNVQVVYGATASLYGSGTLGGAIELSNTPDWKNKSSVGLMTEMGSFSNYKTKLHGKYSNRWISYSGQAFFQYGKNDFTYTDKYDFGSPSERLNHNQNRALGTIQNLHLNINENYIDLGVWYQVKEKNIAGLMGIGKPVSFQKQRDSSFKAFVGWKKLMGKFRLEAKSAYLSDYLKYTDRGSANNTGYKVFSEIESKRWLNDMNLRWYLSDQWSVDVNGKYNWLKGITNNYIKNITENESRLTIAAKYTPQIGTFIFTYGKEWNSEVNPPDMYSLSYLVHLVPNLIDVRGKASTHYRRPTFNERYWINAGNLKLKSEEGWNYELGLVMLSQNVLYGSLTIDLNLYRAQNDNLIVWKPVLGTVWSPVNIGKSLIQGVDVEATHLLDDINYSIRTSLKYAYNDAYDNDKEGEKYQETLGYRPHHLIKFSSDYFRGNWNLGILSTFRSETNTWEGDKVDENVLLDMSVGYRFNTRFANVRLTGRVENLLDKSYEIVRFYPMPGRAFHFGVNIIF